LFSPFRVLGPVAFVHTEIVAGAVTRLVASEFVAGALWLAAIRDSGRRWRFRTHYGFSEAN
jgi:hypothetical protein